MISVERELTQRIGFIAQRPDSRAARTVTSVLRKVVAEDRINDVLEQLGSRQGVEFVEAALELFQFSYRVNSREQENIPAHGPCVIVANHPLGALDGLALIHLVASVRSDFKVVANDVLWQIEALRGLLLPIQNMGGTAARQEIRDVQQALAEGRPVVMFPAGEVSRLKATGVRDCRWSTGFVRFAEKASAPIVPIRIAARNSPAFYGLSMLNKPAAALLLPREMLRQQGSTININVGRAVPLSSLPEQASRRTKAALVRRHLYRLGHKKKTSLLATETPVAHPERRAAIRRELLNGERLGQTPDGKQIVLIDYTDNSSVIRELGRLRELTFRAVGEGTQGRRDVDAFDRYYRHLVLWDDNELEIAGAYRLCETATVLSEYGPDGLYTNGLFEFGDNMDEVLSQGVEMGRSFVQPRYWNSRSLDYLWFGLGAYLARNPQLRYLFGSVSLSADYPASARDLIVGFYRHHYPAQGRSVAARVPFVWNDSRHQALMDVIDGNDPVTDFRALKAHLAKCGWTIPTLFKQYADLTEFGGASFLAFAVDHDFSSCIDGLVLIDMTQLKPKKHQRYIGVHQAGQDPAQLIRGAT